MSKDKGPETGQNPGPREGELRGEAGECSGLGRITEVPGSYP